MSLWLQRLYAFLCAQSRHRALGILDVLSPVVLQLCTGVLYLWHRFLTEITKGLSVPIGKNLLVHEVSLKIVDTTESDNTTKFGGIGFYELVDEPDLYIIVDIT